MFKETKFRLYYFHYGPGAKSGIFWRPSFAVYDADWPATRWLFCLALGRWSLGIVYTLEPIEDASEDAGATDPDICWFAEDELGVPLQETLPD
jgi:hypothetical protein